MSVWYPIASSCPQWITRKGHSTLFVMECGASGDCLFYSVARGYYRWKLQSQWNEALWNQDKTQWMLQMRNWASCGINPSNAHDILSMYQTEWFHDFTWRQYCSTPPPCPWPTHPDTWKPQRWGGRFSHQFPRSGVPPEVQGMIVTQDIRPTESSGVFLDPRHPHFKLLPHTKSVESSIALFKCLSLRTVIQKSGEKFRGDDHCLEWLSTAPESGFCQDRIGFIVLSHQGRISASFYPNHEFRERYLLLLNYHNIHWKLAGVRNATTGTVKSMFDASDLPVVIMETWLQDYVSNVRDMDKNHPMYSYAIRVKDSFDDQPMK
jgi:hypothetical protein